MLINILGIHVKYWAQLCRRQYQHSDLEFILCDCPVWKGGGGEQRENNKNKERKKLNIFKSEIEKNIEKSQRKTGKNCKNYILLCIIFIFVGCDSQCQNLRPPPHQIQSIQIAPGLIENRNKKRNWKIFLELPPPPMMLGNNNTLFALIFVILLKNKKSILFTERWANPDGAVCPLPWKK